MSNYIDTTGKLHFIDNDDFKHLLPQGSIKITQQDADEINSIAIPQVTFEDVRRALQSAIDIKAQEFGFSGGNALMLYAGFINPFQELAVTFAQWESSVWVEAGQYKQDVILGLKPMLTIEQAIALMPVYM